MFFLNLAGVAVPLYYCLHSQEEPVWTAGGVGARFWGELGDAWTTEQGPDFFIKKKKTKNASLCVDNAQVNTIALNPVGTLLVSGCKDGTATIWDTGVHTVLQQVQCHSGTVHHMAFSPGTQWTIRGFVSVSIVRHKLPAFSLPTKL